MFSFVFGKTLVKRLVFYKKPAFYQNNSQFLGYKDYELKTQICMYRDKNDKKELVGRDSEVQALMNAKDEIAKHVLGTKEGTIHNHNFKCEVSILSGTSGAGKSSLLQQLTRSCTENSKWFVLSVKFDKQTKSSYIISSNAESGWLVQILNVQCTGKSQFDINHIKFP